MAAEAAFIIMDIFFDKYADAVIECALKINNTDVLSINTEEENAEFAKLLAAKAKVNVLKGEILSLFLLSFLKLANIFLKSNCTNLSLKV